jgi:hypothetical protein
MNTRKVIKLLSACAGLLALGALAACASLIIQPASAEYYSPLKNAQYVSKGQTIVVRYGPVLTEQDITNLKFSVKGTQSGLHEGQTILADDHKTVIFEPTNQFTPGEQVGVDVNSLLVGQQTMFSPLSYTFTVSISQTTGSPISGSPAPTDTLHSAFPNFLTVPQDIPHFTVSKASPDTGESYIFVAPFYWTKVGAGSYLLILNGQGQLVYYQSAAQNLAAFDFKKQPNGLLSFWAQEDTTIHLIDDHYRPAGTYQAGNGYLSDLHDFHILPNGNALLLAYDQEVVDMSKIVPDGKKNAHVIGLVIQELDPSKNVIFQWRSWDHIPFADSTVNLTGEKVDLVHGNAITVSNDGNLLLSSRNLSEVTKINRQTGDVIWRLGGKANQFKLVNGKPFAYQHDVRQLPDGDITIFDNQGTTQNPAPSHALEYKVDEVNKTATQVWEYTNAPPIFGTYMGNTQRFSDGNTFIGWGAPFVGKGYDWVSMTEVAPDNSILFELSFDQPYVSYRAFRFPWQGMPDTQPALAFKVEGNTITLGYSWNGATEVGGYQVFGGKSPQSLALIEEKAKTDFEMQSQLSNLPKDECYFQVAAVDQSGNEMARSKIITTDEAACPPVGSDQ